MSGRVDEVQATVDACILDVTVTHRRKLLAKVRAVLVLDILYNRIPTTKSTTHPSIPTFPKRQQEGKYRAPILIVNLITVTGSIDNVEAQTHAVLSDDYIEAFR